MNHNLVVLDPAHGGPDAGAGLGSNLLEKDATLAIANRLRAALAAAGFTVVSTREADPPDLLPNDQRAETANRAHAVACLVLHVTATGSGVHVYTSQLELDDAVVPIDFGDGSPPPFVPTPWDRAQAPAVQQSRHLAADLQTAFGASGLPVRVGKVFLRPLDNLTCPAVAVEIAPLAVAGGDATPVTDAGYQQRLAEAVVRAIQFWRGHADPPDVVPGEDFRKAAGADAAGGPPVPKPPAPKPVVPKPPAQKDPTEGTP